MKTGIMYYGRKAIIAVDFLEDDENAPYSEDILQEALEEALHDGNYQILGVVRTLEVFDEDMHMLTEQEAEEYWKKDPRRKLHGIFE